MRLRQRKPKAQVEDEDPQSTAEDLLGSPLKLGSGRAACPAFIPFQLSDEMYASILRGDADGYPLIGAEPSEPKFGYLFALTVSGQRAEMSWPPKSWTNASSRLLLDGRTELVRNYSSRPAQP